MRSPHPHAYIRKINSEPAKALPGVVAVFTHADVPRIAYTTAGHAEPVPDPLDHYLLNSPGIPPTLVVADERRGDDEVTDSLSLQLKIKNSKLRRNKNF
ncbi:hypothetical protein [Fischerella sp.]|uniref:hypothetical protein n=1 Tax=Fischerella sp. TaxID=1191 RepID=UPI0025B9DDDE|nr:hypothetical protein [Fischerella sp.]